MSRTRPGRPEIVLGIVVATLGTLLALGGGSFSASVVVPLAVAAILVLSRVRPGLALGLVWVVAGLHFFLGVPVSVVEVAFCVVAFTTARWGSATVAAAAGASIAGVAALGVLALLSAPVSLLDLVPYPAARAAADLVSSLAALSLLALAWAAGLVLRFSDRAAVSHVEQEEAELRATLARREAEQAQEIARLRDGQARLARDVHDVVGHSLAVILAQAESAQYLPDSDTEKLKATMATIATSARSSLQDVRHVLTTAAADRPATLAPRALDTLVDGVRTSGHDVVSRELGTPQPMPPDLEVVAYRVLQEMLTNAIKHGSRDDPVFVERLWPDGSWADELRIEVRNSLPDRAGPVTGETQPLRALPDTGQAGDTGRALDPAFGPADDGRGLDGMRRRLEACGGRLDVRRRDGDGADGPGTFTATAWVPVRTVSP